MPRKSAPSERSVRVSPALAMNGYTFTFLRRQRKGRRASRFALRQRQPVCRSGRTEHSGRRRLFRALISIHDPLAACRCARDRESNARTWTVTLRAFSWNLRCPGQTDCLLPRRLLLLGKVSQPISGRSLVPWTDGTGVCEALD
ncbi:hypothetical protein HPB50_013372 [Hyalomma asiaticum]|uniref:Uncharacterized protein n=1 Tax=Hyalomma asiaticum TaxID=266040 RepID=A0ACB7SMZ8_HYAAI|nr:hypothetical protein HPB50_013372 [Hyalomma asiaticum]